MSQETLTRLFGAGVAFEDPFVKWAVILVGSLLALAYGLTLTLRKLGLITAERNHELMQRLLSWAVLIPVLFVPVLAGAFWTILILLVLAVLCYREFARMTGQFRNFRVSGWTVVGILLVFLSVLDHWYHLFMALQVLVVVLIAGAGIYVDEPKGYLQRIALGVLSFLFFGVGIGHVAYLANDMNYRAMIILLFLAVELNDIFAYLAGNLLSRLEIRGRRLDARLCPNTSPGKTYAGALGAMVCTSILVGVLSPVVFGEILPHVAYGYLLGIIVSVSGQMGDLVMSSVKRDLGRKDTGTILPGHGGLLDRFDSLLIAGPVYFHFVNYFHGPGKELPVRIFTGGG